MNLGVSPMTNTIYAGKSKPLKNGLGSYWVGKTEDVTDETIKAVFEYMYNKSEKTDYYQLLVEGFGKMSFEREEKDD